MLICIIETHRQTTGATSTLGCHGTLAHASANWYPNGNPVLICIIGTHLITTGRPLEAHWKHTGYQIFFLQRYSSVHWSLISRHTGLSLNYHWLCECIYDTLILANISIVPYITEIWKACQFHMCVPVQSIQQNANVQKLQSCQIPGVKWTYGNRNHVKFPAFENWLNTRLRCLQCVCYWDADIMLLGHKSINGLLNLAKRGSRNGLLSERNWTPSRLCNFADYSWIIIKDT